MTRITDAVSKMVRAYEAMAAVAGDEWHIQNAREHKDAMMDGNLDLEATNNALKLLVSQLHGKALLEG